jgi:predicted nucleic acid-binding protein
VAKEIHANAVLLDDLSARELATTEGLQVRGSVGLLEAFYLQGHLADPRLAFRQLLQHSYMDRRLLDLRLLAKAFLRSEPSERKMKASRGRRLKRSRFPKRGAYD